MSEQQIHSENMEERLEETSQHSHRHEHSHHEEHSHHGEHHHHHRKKRKKKSLKDKLPRFMRGKKFWQNMAILLAALIFISAVAAIATNLQRRGEEQERPAQSQEQNAQTVSDAPAEAQQNTISVQLPYFTEAMPLVGNAALACASADPQIPVEQVIGGYKEPGERLDKGLPVKLSYNISDLPQDCTVVSVAVKVSEDSSFKQYRAFSMTGSRRDLMVYHLKTDTQYYYQMHIQLSNGGSTMVQGSFRTADGPRVLGIEGAVNVRDFGGWKTKDGRTVRQGRLYRGSELDGAVEPEYKLTSKGLEDMLVVLGIHTDMDLRTKEENPLGTDALGGNVEHIYYEVPMYEQVFEDYAKDRVRAVFSKLANENSYPIYMHCTYGMDRTGTVCYLLGALLGMSEEDLLREYRLSALYHRTVAQDLLGVFTAELETYPGNTLQEKTERYLLSVGVTQQELDAICKIMLE